MYPPSGSGRLCCLSNVRQGGFDYLTFLRTIMEGIVYISKDGLALNTRPIS